MANIFREARRLLQEKPISEIDDEEMLTVKAADIPLTLLKMFNDINTLDGLEKLVKIV